MSRPSGTAEPELGERPRRGLARLGLDRRGAVLLVGMSAALLASELAETVVATALPTIAADLGDLRLLALVTTGYLVTSTAVLPAYGWLSDRFGRRRLFVVAVALFLLGSVLGALAPGAWTLVGARLVQGCGAGGLLVLVQAEVAVLVPLRQRAAVMSGVGAVFAAAVVLGPPLGGWLAAGPGWRWAFWLNLPLALAAVVAAVALMPDDRPSPRAARPHSPLTVFRRRQVRLATAGGLLLGASSFGMLVYLPTYLQLVLGLDPAMAGVLMLALFGGLGVFTVVAAQVVRRAGPVRALLVVGALCVAAGLALLAAGTPATLVGVVPALVLLGAGIGCVWEVVVVVVQAGVDQSEVGTATGANNLLRETGVVLGTATVGAWVTHALAAAGEVGGRPLATWGPARLAAASETDRAAVAGAYGDAFGPAFWALVPVALLAALAFSRLRPWVRA